MYVYRDVGTGIIIFVVFFAVARLVSHALITSIHYSTLTSRARSNRQVKLRHEFIMFREDISR